MSSVSAPGLWPHVIVLDPYTAGLAVARQMVRRGARVTVLLDPGDPYLARSRGVEALVMPFDDGARWLGKLQEIAAQSEAAVAIPASDRSCELLVHAADSLPASLRTFERSSRPHLALMDKDQADLIAQRAGVSVPWTARICDQEQLTQALEQAPWPCVVKPALSHEWRARYGPTRVFLAPGPDQAAQLLERPLSDGLKMLLCQYIPGGDEDVEEAIVVRLADGSYPVQFGCRKLRQLPRGFGVTAVGEASSLAKTMALAKRVLDEAGFVGVAGVETKRHAQTGERWFLEVNVRIPGQWGLGDACGVLATPRLISALSGQALLPQPPIREGVRIVLPDVDISLIASALSEASLWQRPAILLRMMRPYVGARDFGLLDRRDPGPGVAFLKLIAARVLGRLANRLRPRSRASLPSGED